MPDDIDADAFFAAHEAAPDLDPEQLRKAVDAYLDRLHLTVRRVHSERELSADEVLDAFRPRDIEF